MALFPTTLRWNDGDDAERYDAVEAHDDGLLWYAWSHVHGRGREHELAQSFDAFLRDGPPRAMPARARAELEVIVRSRVGTP